MGKKGDALRAERAANARYTFTGAELEARDRMLIDRYRNQIMEDCTRKLEAQFEQNVKEVDEHIAEEWKKREAMFQDNGEKLSEVLRLLLATSSRILIERFGWKPIPKDGNYDGRNRTHRFAKCLAEEINMITGDETKDIRQYCDETYEKYGVKFLFEE